MKRSLSLLVVQVFTLNTLLSSSGLAHVAWSPKFQMSARQVASENESAISMKDIMSISSHNGGIYITKKDGSPITISQNDVDPKNEIFDLSKGSPSKNGQHIVYTKDGKEIPFENFLQFYNHSKLIQNKTAYTHKWIAAVAEIDEKISGGQETIKADGNPVRVFAFQADGQTVYRMILGKDALGTGHQEVQFDFPELTRREMIAILDHNKAAKYKGDDPNLKEFAKFFGGYSLNDFKQVIQDSDKNGYNLSMFVQQVNKVAIPNSKLVVGSQGERTSFASQNSYGSVNTRVNAIERIAAPVKSNTASNGTKLDFNTLTNYVANSGLSPYSGSPNTNEKSMFGTQAYGSINQTTPQADPMALGQVARHQATPEKFNVPGSSMVVDATASFAPSENDEKDGEKDSEKEKPLKIEAQKVEVSEVSEADRKAVYEMFSPKQIRRMLKEDRRELVKEEIANWLRQAQFGRDHVATADWQKSIWGAQTRRFPMETVMFFFAISAINFAMLQADFSQNPLVMEQHFQTLTDPIGHISFYSFMIVNGYAAEFLNSRGLSKEITAAKMKNYLMAPYGQSQSRLAALAAAKGNLELQNKILTVMADDAISVADRKASFNPFTNSIAKKAYIGMIPYLSMTAGSMASHFSGDFLRTLQSCVTGMYQDPRIVKERPPAGQPKIKDRLNNISEDPCDTAWREWVMEKKFNQYSPALMSMILSTAGSAVLTKMFKSSEKIGPIGKIFETVRNSKQAVATKLKFEGSNFVLRKLGEKLSSSWLSTFTLIGHFSNITIFTALDTAIHSWVEDKVLNFNYGVYSIWPKIDAFPRKAEILNDLIVKEGNEKFMKESAACEKDLDSAECRRNDIEGWLHNFSQSMSKWREFNQTKALQAHSQWVDKINKFQTMERFSKTFYERFMLDIKNRLLCFSNKEECFSNPAATVAPPTRVEDMVKAHIAAEQRGDLSTLVEDRSFLNYRQYPLYGVEPILADFKEPDKWKKNYMMDPDRVQELQQEKVHKVAQLFESYILQKGLDSSDLKNHKEKLKEIIAGLKSEDPYQNGLAINLMRTFANASGGQVNDVLQRILQNHLDMMGRPAPLLYYGQGFPYLFETSDLYKDLVRDVELPEFYRHLRLSTQFRFEKKTDYLYYHMLCGPNPEKAGIGGSVVDGSLGNLYGYGLLGFRDLFIPPKIINDNLDLDICSDKLTFNTSSKLYNTWILDRSRNTKFAGAFNVIEQNLTESMKKIALARKYALDPELAKSTDRQKVLSQPVELMSVWWEKYVENQVQTQLEKFKVQYEEIAVKFLEAQFKENGTFMELPIHSAIVRNSVVDSTLQESRTYSLVLSEVFKKHIPAAELAKLFIPNESVSQYKGYRKQTTPEDIIVLQKRPFHQDLEALKTGAIPKLFSFQLLNEEILRELSLALKKAEIQEKPDSDGKLRKVIDLKLSTTEIEDLEKKIEDSIKKMYEEIDGLAKLIPAAKENPNAVERLKPLRIIEFTKNNMGKLARDLVATLSTIRFASAAAESYAKKYKTKEDLERDKARAQDQEKRKQCIKQKSAAGISGGGGC